MDPNTLYVRFARHKERTYKELYKLMDDWFDIRRQVYDEWEAR